MISFSSDLADRISRKCLYRLNKRLSGSKIWRPQQREIEPEHRMPAGVEGELRQTRVLEPSAIIRIVKQRAKMAGLAPEEFSAHGLRSGYLTETAAFRCPRPWNNPAIAPCSKHQIITTMPNGAADAHRGCFNALIGGWMKASQSRHPSNSLALKTHDILRGW